jgi:hypothetical protein
VRDAESRTVDLTCEPDLEQVSSVHEFVESYYKTVVEDNNVICRMAVAAYEVLKNHRSPKHRGDAVRHGALFQSA